MTIAQRELVATNIGETTLSTWEQLIEHSDDSGTWTNPGSLDFEQASKLAHPLRILVIATEAPPVRGGIARIVGYLKDGLQAQGHSVDVLAYPEVGRIVFGEVRLSMFLFKLPSLLRRISNYDVIHIHGTTPTISDLFLLFAHLCCPHIPVVYTHHLDLDFKLGGFLNTLYNRVHHSLSTYADAVVAATSDTLSLLKSSPGSFIIPYGINLQRFSINVPKEELFTVLFVGQFRPWKGVRVLLQAMSQVANARLLVVGQGPEEQIYRKLAAKLSLDVEFHINVSDKQLGHLYQRASVVVLPSVARLEAFGLALVEGMAAGCVPVASDLPGVREVAGPVGKLFPVGDAHQLAKVLCELRDNPERTRNMAERARIFSRSFDQERTIREYGHLFQGLVASRNLQKQLPNSRKAHILALCAFMDAFKRDLEADWAGLVLQPEQDILHLVASTGTSKFLTKNSLQHACALLAQHALSTGETLMIEPQKEILGLNNELIRGVPAAAGVPLTYNGESFGAILAMREQPFTQENLVGMQSFALYAASALHSIMKTDR